MNVFKAMNEPRKRIKRIQCSCGGTMTLFQKGYKIAVFKCESCSSTQLIVKEKKTAVSIALPNIILEVDA